MKVRWLEEICFIHRKGVCHPRENTPLVIRLGFPPQFSPPSFLRTNCLSSLSKPNFVSSPNGIIITRPTASPVTGSPTSQATSPVAGGITSSVPSLVIGGITGQATNPALDWRPSQHHRPSDKSSDLRPYYQPSDKPSDQPSGWRHYELNAQSSDWKHYRPSDQSSDWRPSQHYRPSDQSSDWKPHYVKL